MSEMWSSDENTEKVVVYVAGKVVKLDPPVTADDIRRIAREHGIRNFYVENGAADGGVRTLSASDFPVESPTELRIVGYNAPKQ